MPALNFTRIAFPTQSCPPLPPTSGPGSLQATPPATAQTREHILLARQIGI